MLDLISRFLIQLGFAIAILVGGWLATKYIVSFVRKYLTHRKIDLLLVNFTASILYWTLILVVVIAALSAVGINTTSLIALLGASAVAIGLALQDSLKNFASGVLLIIFRPFNVDDFIEAGDASGSVEEITLFTTLLRTPDNRSVIVPNSAIYSGNITNYSARDTRRVDMVFGIGYDDDVRKAHQILTDVLAADKRVLADPAPQIAVSELADSSVNFVVRPWVQSGDYWDVKFDLTERVKLAFDENGISIPYPQMDVHVDGDAVPTADAAS